LSGLAEQRYGKPREQGYDGDPEDLVDDVVYRDECAPASHILKDGELQDDDRDAGEARVLARCFKYFPVQGRLRESLLVWRKT
jgi:hypothetical protein